MTGGTKTGKVRTTGARLHKTGAVVSLFLSVLVLCWQPVNVEAQRDGHGARQSRPAARGNRGMERAPRFEPRGGRQQTRQPRQVWQQRPPGGFNRPGQREPVYPGRPAYVGPRGATGPYRNNETHAPRPSYPGEAQVRPALPGGGMPRSYAFPPGHLGSWLNQHPNLPLRDQEGLLRSDPSFNRLPQAQQQRLVQQLRQVDRMPAQERERRLARAEAIEHMSARDRQQLYQSSRELSTLPADRRTLVKQAFRDLSGVPADQRQTVINSQRYQNQFSPEERNILTNLLRAEPYQPPQP